LVFAASPLSSLCFNGKNMFLLSVLAAAGGTGQFAVSNL
jgi:hypothetical protein